MAEQVLTGGCQCGAVRYAARGEPVLTAICHCAMCRRASAAPMVGWAMFELGQVEFEGVPRAEHPSSPGARRGFCPKCGTPISFTGQDLPGLIDLTIGSLDDPAKLPPQFHYWDSARLPWVAVADGLPRHAGFPPLD